MQLVDLSKWRKWWILSCTNQSFLSSGCHFWSSKEEEKRNSMLLLLLLPELNIASAKLATKYWSPPASLWWSYRAVEDGPAPGMLLLLLPLPPATSIESHLPRPVDEGCMVILWDISCVISAADGRTDGAVNDIWQVWSPW